MADRNLPCWLLHKYNGQSDILWDCNYEHVYPIGPFVLCRLCTAITNFNSTRIMDVRQVLCLPLVSSVRL